jgi:preprotein translocase subunit SecF
MMKPILSGKMAFLVLLSFLFVSARPVRAQADMPAVMDSASLEAQMDYLKERTRIYNGYRAVRDDIFLKMADNSLDSLNREKLEVARLNSELSERNNRIETLNGDLSRTSNERDQAIRTKDSFSFLGLQVQKGLYNTIMWIIVLGLVLLGVILFLMFKRSYAVTSQTRKELRSLQEEFEEYRKTSREKYEKLVVSHHNEIMKLKRS